MVTSSETAFYVTVAILTLVIVICIIFLLTSSIDNSTTTPSTVDSREYIVRDSGNPSTNTYAANYLATLHSNATKIIEYMVSNKVPDQVVAQRLATRWATCTLRETGSNEGSVAYTLNKGTEIRICIRDKAGNFEDPNNAMFVLLHELAHMMSATFGHNEEFRNNFYEIIRVAVEMGLYKPVDYSQSPVVYCGMQINTTPCAGGACY